MKKVLCKRTYFEKNSNLYPINGKEYGENWVKWKKGKHYNFRIPKEHEKKVGVYLKIECERESFWSPIKEKEFHKHFIDLIELRNNKINEILK